MKANESSRLRRRIAGPVLGVSVLLLAAELLGGAASPLVGLSISGCLLALTLLAAALAGPSLITPGLTLAAVLATVAATLLIIIHGEAAAPAATASLAGGGLWLIGALAGRRPADADFAMDAVIWTSFLFCCALLVLASNGTLRLRTSLLEALPSPADIPLLFTVFLIMAAGRLVQIHGRAPRIDLAPVIWTEELIHRGVGSLLLAGVSTTGLVVCVSAEGALTALAGICLIVCLRPSEPEKARSRVQGLTLAALLGLAGLVAGFVHPETIRTESLDLVASSMERWSVYLRTIPEALINGHGPEAIREIADRSATLTNASILAAPGGARNAVIHYLVQWGLSGAIMMTAGLVFIHQPITGNQVSPRFARSASRTALATGSVILLWGLTSSSLETPVIAWLYVFLLGIAAGSNVPQRAGSRTMAGPTDRSFPLSEPEAGFPAVPGPTRSGVDP